MGEEEKKPEEKKPEEAKKPVEEEKKKKEEEQEETKKPIPEEKKENNNNNEEKTPKEEKDKAPQPPQEIVLKVYMHCEGCARKVRRSLKGFQGVEDVITDCKTSKVVVKGEKADPIKVLERVQRKSHRQVELISPIPKPPSEEDKKPEEEKPKPEEKKEEPQIVTVVLKVYMHCEACALEIEKRIIRMKGVESAEADLKSSQVTVKGALDPNKLVEYVYKRTGKQAVIVKQDPDIKEEKKDEKKSDTKKEEIIDKNQGEENKKKEESSEKQNDDNGKEEDVVTEENKVVEIKRNEYNYYYPQRYAMELYAYNSYAPQIFSDENPNACSIM